MKKIVMSAIVGTFSGALLVTQVAGPLVAQEVEAEESVYQQLDLFGDIFERIRSQYVEEVSTEDLVTAAINGMLTSLDPHSSYLSAKDFEDMQVQTKGEFGGLGIEVTQEEGYIKVISPMDDTPADKAGVLAGDYITHVNGEALLGLVLDDAVEKMRGPIGSEIIITIVREGTAEPFDVSIIRDTIKLTAVKGRVVGNTVVLRITTFNDQTTSGMIEELNKGIEELGGIENLDGVVMDLRNNPGGLLNEAISVSDAFLEKGEIVSTRSRIADSDKRYNAEPGDIAAGKPIVLLINGGSASASEIVAGALQDHRRAIVVGTKSFGKGSVQSLIPLRGDGAMRLTTARYYTPSGRSIQALGISPDIVVKQPVPPPVDPDAVVEEKSAVPERSEADLRGSITNDSMTEEEKRLYLEELDRAEESAKLRDEDYQLAYAIDIIKGLTAIAPDTP
ncbi:Prc Periplasmic protease [Paracoccaceae bacterium]|jgi:carboxyl-terminal processing protease